MSYEYVIKRLEYLYGIDKIDFNKHILTDDGDFFSKIKKSENKEYLSIYINNSNTIQKITMVFNDKVLCDLMVNLEVYNNRKIVSSLRVTKDGLIDCCYEVHDDLVNYRFYHLQYNGKKGNELILFNEFEKGRLVKGLLIKHNKSKRNYEVSFEKQSNTHVNKVKKNTEVYNITEGRKLFNKYMYNSVILGPFTRTHDLFERFCPNLLDLVSDFDIISKQKNKKLNG